MAEYYLKDLTTEHPGGWEDIIAYVNAHFDRYKANYKAIDATLNKSLNYKVKKVEVVHTIRSVVTNEILPRLEEVHHLTSGIAAGMGWAILRTLDLPLPGSKEWKKPCSTWKADE